jgi:ubiquinone/menaquinone biosynthesis C-methylase UbiE
MVAAEMVGKDGTVIAADIHPLAIKQIQRSASKKGLTNITTVLTGGNTGLPDSSIDIILLYYVLHDFHNPYGIIRELYRVLKSDGILTVLDHKLRDQEVSFIDQILFRVRVSKQDQWQNSCVCQNNCKPRLIGQPRNVRLPILWHEQHQ